MSRKVARLLDSFRPGSTSYCPFPGKNFEPDGNNNHRAAAPPTFPLLLRPSEVPVERQEFRSQPVDIPQATPPVSPASTPSSLVSPTHQPFFSLQSYTRRKYLNQQLFSFWPLFDSSDIHDVTFRTFATLVQYPYPKPHPDSYPQASSPPLSVSREEETRRQLYLPLGRPRPFYSVQPPDQSAHQVNTLGLGACFEDQQSA